jgi:glutamine cyclotransferase
MPLLSPVHRLALALFLSFATPALAAPTFGYTVVARFPHATSSYTEGFFFRDGLFFEGTGLEGHSALLVYPPATGVPIQTLNLPPDLFGEGIVDFGTELFEWTWKSHLCFVYDRATLHLLRQLPYTGEGWGMTRTPSEIITSDGTDTLRFRDPATFREIRHITVHDGSTHIRDLNELEFIHGEIYANLWHTDTIARISPADGHILSWIDLTGLLPDSDRLSPESVLNGIAFDPIHDRLFVTGKQWPTIFEIKLSPTPR